MSDNITQFPRQPSALDEMFVGPFEYFQVVVDGRAIPNLTGRELSDGSVSLTVDNRFGADFPSKEVAYQAAYLIANAMAIGAGYSHLGAESRDQPFAPRCGMIELPSQPA